MEGGKLSTRNGNVIYAEQILHEAIEKIHEIINEKNPDLPNKEEVSRQVGIGAILFNDLYNQRIKDVIRFLTLMERQVHMYSTLTQDVPVYSVR